MKTSHQRQVFAAQLQAEREKLNNAQQIARQMTEAELSELCIHAAHILENRINRRST